MLGKPKPKAKEGDLEEVGLCIKFGALIGARERACCQTITSNWIDVSARNNKNHPNPIFGAILKTLKRKMY